MRITALLFLVVIQVLSHEASSKPPIGYLKSYRITSVATSHKYIYVGTVHGLWRQNLLNKEVREFDSHNSDLPSDHITAICCLRNGNVMIGTSNGIMRYDGFAYTVMRRDNSPLPDNFVTAIVEDKDGNLWIGTMFGGLVKMYNHHYAVFNKDNSCLPSNYIFSVSLDSEGGVWVSPLLSGLYKLSGKGWKKAHFNDSTLNGSNFSFILPKGDHVFYACSYEKGIYNVIYKGDELIAVNCVDSCEHHYLFGMAFKNKLIIGSYNEILSVNCFSEVLEHRASAIYEAGDLHNLLNDLK